MKQEYLAVHDYGTGGVWVVITAQTPQEIVNKYPFLQVVTTRPTWMTDEGYAETKRRMSFDIDNPPTEGNLAKFLQGALLASKK